MNNYPQITFHGAARTVTGSCMELRHDGQSILIDCGLFQGSRTLEILNREPFAFDPTSVSAVILTHAHIDHSGLLPKLVAAGFVGKIWCTHATADLLHVMLPDSGRIQEYEAARRNRRADRADEDAITPIYTEADAHSTCAQLRRVDLDTWFEPVPDFRARLWNAGHILGSASAELMVGGSHLLFSGDLGPDEKAFHPDPQAPVGVDHVICESTYGDRKRAELTIQERRNLLEAEIRTALARGGNLIVPVFALERTQELLLDIASLINSGHIPHTRVFVDSPLASKATEVFAKHSDQLEDMGSGDVFEHSAFHFTESTAESMMLNQMSGAVILSASGMCEAGRIRHHLFHNLGRRESTILFVGFQASGTLGRTILEGAPRVRISGRDVAVRAQIRRIDSYSAHADQDDLVRWAKSRRPIAGSVFMTHGEAGAVEALGQLLREASIGASIIAPDIGECYALPAKAAAKRLALGRKGIARSAGWDWQNEYADFSVNLKHELSAIRSDAARREAIEKMRVVLRSYTDNRAAHKRSHDRRPPAQRRPA